MVALTFITPVSPDHQQYLPACTASVKDQTVSCQHLVMVDDERRGPGYMRNRLLAQATTEYVSFLDADDWLEPDYAEKMLTAVQRSTYVYSDWYQDGQVRQAPEKAWCNSTFHLVTAVIPRMLAVQVGGFDETLPALEDTDFFLKFISREWCGRRVPLPLVHYRANGGRSEAIHRETNSLELIRAELLRRYGGRPVGCCGNSSEVNDTPVGQAQPGDILAMALWGGNRTEHGRATGRRYPRISYPKTTWVDPRDVRAAPHLWKDVTAIPEQNAVRVEQLSPLPAPRGVAAIRGALMQQGVLEEPAPVSAAPSVAAIPNFTKVKRLAGAVDLPVFVAPYTTYPSYTDFWKLVEQSGFETVFPSEINLGDGTKAYIFTGPEAIPDCSGARAKTIFWQLEYLGDYANQGNIGTVGQVWSSDPDHARRTGSKFVLMGSHKGLNPKHEHIAEGGYTYDLTMLAYMTPRRQAIKDALDEYEWAPDYPGHGTDFRHDVLTGSRLMLNVNQFDEPSLAPLRLALAAAYALPVLAEKVVDSGPYKKAVIWTAYSRMAKKAIELLGPGFVKQRHDARMALYELLCEEHPFFDCVMEALK